MNYIANILTWLEKADSGFNWYFDTHDWVKSLPGDLMQNCGLVAAFSCNTAWEHNKRCTVDYLKTGTTGHLGDKVKRRNPRHPKRPKNPKLFPEHSRSIRSATRND